MGQVRNILFIMYDQLRHDYLSCAGHPSLQTPNMDWLASRGVRFTNAYVQSPICGSSRMSFYTGRYVHSHGAQRNNYPLRVGEMTLGDHLRPLGMDCVLVGKTHMKVDAEGMRRLGIGPESVIGARISECGFDAFIRDDGLWAEGVDGPYDHKSSPYNDYLLSRGYNSTNPWADFANAGRDADGEIASGWFLHHADKPAAVRNEDSETPWLTREAMRFMDERRNGAPWLCHLSYIKPHWPYIVTAPYHAMFGPANVLAANRSESEQEDPHPVLKAFMDMPVSIGMSRDDVRAKAIPAYMGLIRQCDDELGRLLGHLRSSGRLEDTLIVLTSDHGDYLGDHWLGEKGMFHDASVKVPLIMVDPSAAADNTRGTVCDALVEAIDLAATFVDYASGEVPGHIIEGRSLRPFLQNESPSDWREFAVSEYDFATTSAAAALGLEPRDARLFMIADHDWKFIHAEGGFRPILFNMSEDPNELYDVGDDAANGPIIDLMYRRLGRWARRMSQRTAISDAQVLSKRGAAPRRGVLLGVFDEADVPREQAQIYRDGRRLGQCVR